MLKGEPDWQALPADVPPAIRGLIRGCLRRERKERVGDIAAALFVLRGPSVGDPPASLRPGRKPARSRAMPVASGVMLGLAIAVAALWHPAQHPHPSVTRLAFTPPAGQRLTANRRAVAISPDGSRIVYTANGGLFLRSLSDFEATAIPGANPAASPEFSPDGESLVFSAAGEAIKRIGVRGGTAVTICRVSQGPTSLAWAGGDIVYSEQGSIMRVSANGGRPETLVDFSDTQDFADGPQLLPDRDTLLFGIVKRADAALGRWDEAVVLQSLRTGHRTLLVERGRNAQYVPTGHIVYAADGALLALPFELSTLKATGAAVPVIEGLGFGATAGIGTGPTMPSPARARSSTRRPGRRFRACCW